VLRSAQHPKASNFRDKSEKRGAFLLVTLVYRKYTLKLRHTNPEKKKWLRTTYQEEKPNDNRLRSSSAGKIESNTAESNNTYCAGALFCVCEFTWLLREVFGSDIQTCQKTKFR